MNILGIETSCDETSAAVVADGVTVLSNVIASSANLHEKTGGVVPEVAARDHIRQITPVIDHALKEAKIDWDQIDAIAVTHAPGLIGSLLVGVNTAQALAYIRQKPLIPVHHIAGHLYANFLEREIPPRFPIVALTVSGGHNELVLIKGHGDFTVIGETLDDAAGEAFDKVARLLGLGFPGGPAVSKMAEKGDPNAFDFPRAWLDEKNRYNFSFSGLKTAVSQTVRSLGDIDHKTMADLCASFERAVAEVLAGKLAKAAKEFGAKEAHLAGGVSANRLLRAMVLQKIDQKMPVVFPHNLIYCTDNAAMIAGAAYFLSQKTPPSPDNWKNVEVFSQLPLESA